MPKEYTLEFQPAQKRRRDLITRFFLGFGAIILLLVIASAFAAQKDGAIDRIINAYFRPTEPETEAEEGAWNYEGSALFLLCETDAAAQNLRFVFLARVNAGRRQITIFPLSPQAKAPVGAREITLEQALREGGVKALQTAAEALTETRIDRYIASDDNGFTKTINTLGSVTVKLDERISYNSPRDFTLTLAEGTQRLQGDMLLRYFRYLGTLKEDPPMRQGALLALVLETYLVPKNADSPEKLEQKFSMLVNSIQTDVSVMDLSANRDLLLALLAEPAKITIEVKE